MVVQYLQGKSRNLASFAFFGFITKKRENLNEALRFLSGFSSSRPMTYMTKETRSLCPPRHQDRDRLLRQAMILSSMKRFSKRAGLLHATHVFLSS